MAIIVGDIHGNLNKVKAFLGYKPDELHIALGDYVDSFFESSERQEEALQLLINSAAILIWGNHDLAYLKFPPFGCSGYQGSNSIVHSIIENNKKRFHAAYSLDGWLISHAGVQEGLVKTTNIDKLAAMLNERMADFINNPRKMTDSIFNVGIGRGGLSRCGGIFWFDFLRECCLSTKVKQIFGHTEIKEPFVTETYINLDTTNSLDTCYLFDTQTNEIVTIKMTKRKIIVITDKITTQGMLYWGFADSQQLVIVAAKTAQEAWKKGVVFWHTGQTITPLGVLPLNAREISHRRIYNYDQKTIWISGPKSNAYFFEELNEESETGA